MKAISLIMFRLLIFKIKYQENIHALEIGKKAFHKGSYWKEITTIPEPDVNQLDLLSGISRQFLNVGEKVIEKDFDRKAPEDIYPVY